MSRFSLKKDEPLWRKHPEADEVSRDEASEMAKERELRTDELKRKTAIVVVFLAVFYFFIKLLFL